MARTTVKATYTLDADTIRELERIARALGTTKSDTIRRAIALLARAQPSTGDEALAALDDMQEQLPLSVADAAAWQTAVRAERDAAGS